jgi:hypothetical protein
MIIVGITVDGKYNFKMLLDTGASHTTIDSHALILNDCNVGGNVGLVQIETANGVMEAELFEVSSFFSLGITREHFEIQVYDFLAHGILSPYDGTLGLDFFKEINFCIYQEAKTITIQPRLTATGTRKRKQGRAGRR